MKRIALIQPLPALLTGTSGFAYSEFGSLGMALLGGVLRQADYDLTGIRYPSTHEEVERVALESEIIVAGDFRYYAYFCNPLPLVNRVLDILDAVEFSGKVLLAGRHAAFFPRKIYEGRSYSVHVCPTMPGLAIVLGLHPNLSMQLGADILPRPNHAPVDLILTKNLPGSISRPTLGLTGQIITTAGCRFRCSFCEKAGTAIVSIGRNLLERQLNEFRSAGAKYLIVWDEVFAQNGSELETTLGSFRTAGISFGCNTRAEIVTEPIVDQLANAGCKAVLFGIEIDPREEAARRVLRVDRSKSPRATRLQQVTKLLASQGIQAVGSVIIGLPGDTPEIIRSRLINCESLGFSHLYVRPLVPFPESAIYSSQVKAGRIRPYADWNFEQWDTYPHGYPTLCDIPRRELCQLAGRAI